jgi:hypothetical protein
MFLALLTFLSPKNLLTIFRPILLDIKYTVIEPDTLPIIVNNKAGITPKTFAAESSTGIAVKGGKIVAKETVTMYEITLKIIINYLISSDGKIEAQ